MEGRGVLCFHWAYQDENTFLSLSGKSTRLVTELKWPGGKATGQGNAGRASGTETSCQQDNIPESLNVPLS